MSVSGQLYTDEPDRIGQRRGEMKAYVKPPDARMPDQATKASIGNTREVVQSQACTAVDNPKVTKLGGAQKEADSSPAASRS